MKITYHHMPAWPTLAWACRCIEAEGSVSVFHGTGVEVRDDWFCEAVWDGVFSEGGFDKTDIVSGSGGRVRDGVLIFVSSGSTVDRLQWLDAEGSIWVSNSLACLLSMTNASIKEGYGGYHDDFAKIVGGLGAMPLILDTSKGQVHYVYFHNLAWDGAGIESQEKPDSGNDLERFDDYHDLLRNAIFRLSKNMSDTDRKVRYEFLGTLSSGYDSTTVTTLGSVVGCNTAIGFSRARGGNEDHGSRAADALNIDLRLFDRQSWLGLAKEYLFIAADAKGEDRYFASTEELLGCKVLLTGYHGDKIWDKKTKNLSRDIVRGDRSGLSLTEYRLHAGFFNCAVPFWFVRHIQNINRISNSPEMKPWDTGPSYSRPVCRRICEEMGIPRGGFGVKKNASSELPYTSSLFLSPELMKDYIGWLKRHRWKLVLQNGFPIIVSPVLDRLLCKGVNLVTVLARKVVPRLAKSPVIWRFSSNDALYRLGMLDVLVKPMYLRRYLFPWALERAKRHYPASVTLTDSDT